MSATSPTSPFDELGLEVPFAKDNAETDRFEAGPAWNELGESPFAGAPASEGSWQEGPERLQAEPEDEGLAWLDMEAADANAEAFGAEDLALDGEALHEHEHLHENEDEALLDDTECESGYLDADAERFESEIWADSAEQIAFRNRVLAAHIASKGRAPFPDLSSEQLQTLENVPGTKIKTLPATAAAAGRLLDAANADLTRAQQAGDADALRTIRLSVISGHRSSQVQKGLWLRYFSAKGGYYDTTQVARERLPDGPHSDQAVRYMLERQDNGGFGLGGRIAAPGYSNHQNGIAIDFSQERRKGHGIRNKSDSKSRARWRSTWFHHWLRKNAKIFFFQPLKTEEWHWEYHPPGLKARFEGATRGELGQEARGGGSVASWEQANEESLYSEAEYAEEGAVPAPFLRTFTAKALGVKVAVYVTQAACSARQVEMLVFAHGLDLCKPVFKNRPATFITERPFKLGELVEATGRPIVLVVPFLDWERLAANRMAFGRKWHRLAQPANFNQVAAEALDQVRAITNSADAPTVQRLILAGHSRAYGFFDALAHEHASPQMRTGALACPTHVWALDTTYSAPIADWRAWLLSRNDLQATVVYRQGTYRTRGSIVRELVTGVRGREFSKLAAASNGRLTVMPVSAGKVSHCAIPTAYLPRLFATLPAPAASGEYAGEAQYEEFEEFEEGEDYAGLATEADAESEADPVSSIVISDYPRYGRAMPPTYREMLQPLVTKIIETVSSGGTIRVSIIGHADFDAKGREFETKVSMERATVGQQTLLLMLMPQAGIVGLTSEKMLAALDLTLEGMGTKQPIESRPVNEDQRKRNRRVEFFWEVPSRKRPLPPLPPPDDARGLTYLFGGVTAAGTDERLNGERVVRFILNNYGIDPSTVSITDNTHRVTQSRRLAVHEKAELEFPALRPGRIERWTFRIQPNPRATIGYYVYTQVPTKSQEHAFDNEEEADATSAQFLESVETIDSDEAMDEAHERPDNEALAWLDMEGLAWNEDLGETEASASGTYAEGEALDSQLEFTGEQMTDEFERLDQFEDEGEAEWASDRLEPETEYETEYETKQDPVQFASEHAEADTLVADVESESIANFEDETPPVDTVDAFLESRRSLYQVTLVGTNVHVTLPRSHEWTSRYTDRALAEGALGAAISVMYRGGVTAAQTRKAYEQVVGHGVKYMPAPKQADGDNRIHRMILFEVARTKFAQALNLSPKAMTEAWAARIGEAKMIEFAIGSAYRSFDRLVPHFSSKALAAAGMSVDLIRFHLDKESQSMIEVAKRHPTASAWRAAYKRNPALHWGEREPVLADFDKVPLSQWARTILELATATRKTVREQFIRQREEDRKHGRNEYLRPHEIKVEDVAKFILETYDSIPITRFYRLSWTFHGGQQLRNIKGEPIFLLSAVDDRVIFQHLGNRKFYRQSLQGFLEEQFYGIYAEAGRKSLGAIALTKWVIGLAGAVFPPVRYGLMATDVLNAAIKLQGNRAELERSYDSVKLAYANIDALLPGVLPKIWDAVLDKRNAALFNPLKNPDAGAWLKVVIRLVMLRQARVISASYASDEVTGFLNKAWAAIKGGLASLWEVVKHAIVLAPAVAGSTGISGQRALDLAQQRLAQLGVIDAAAIVVQIKRLSKSDGERLAFEVQDLVKNGTKLVEVVGKAMSW